jgi:putative heme-binding domain-containing protein
MRTLTAWGKDSHRSATRRAGSVRDRSAGSGSRVLALQAVRSLTRPDRRVIAGSIGAIFAALFLVAASAPAAEKWADPNLSVTDGLVLWLDASRLNGARTVAGKPAVNDGDAVDLWPDASGHARHARQATPTARPSYRQTATFRSVRFDGKEDHFTAPGPDKPLRDVTVFVVAAPHSDPGAFAALMALTPPDKNDFQAGLNVDLGVGVGPQFQTLNVEGTGTVGWANLLRDRFDFGSVVRLGVASSPGKGGIALWANGKPQGRRDRASDKPVEAKLVVIGARSYGFGGPPRVTGFLEGDIAEVLVYDRSLSDTERAAVDSYLADKYGAVPRLPVGPVEGKALERVKDPPPVQMLVPGLTVRQLPLDLTNVNNVLYRPDGKLVALGYDGRVHLLSDTDGDGLEDKAELFWEGEGTGKLRSPIGMALTPPGYKHGDGVFVAAKGKCVLIVDTDRDGKADKEIVVAAGWKELPHGVDALGVAVDPRDGSVYFGLGTTNFTDAYLNDKGRKPAEYSLKSERGTILRVSPDFQSREIVATGIRFPVGMRFNKDGDLFCTDQEGATWLANGNPFDELLHIQKGRHYGFPPRHPVALPNVIDEPSTFDYGPQHQSACGLNFNEPVNGGRTFGPGWWKSDVLVAGYSRGKLYRTALVKTPAGYVAKTQLLACLSMLACDVCVSPKGELAVAVHSGPPDWGTGAAGTGKLYKIAYTGADLPQPVAVWAQTPREVRVAFDRPLAPADLEGVGAGARIEYGRYVSPGDRFEQLFPPYQMVQDQRRIPRYDLPLYGVQVAADRRTLILATAPHPEAVSYALTLPGLGRTAAQKKGELRQLPETELGYDLTGVKGAWRAADGGHSTTLWLPHLDLVVAQAFSRKSADHDAFWAQCRTPGELTLTAALDLRDMLRPAVQPGEKLDYEWPAERVTLRLRSRGPFAVTVGTESAAAKKDADGYTAAVTVGGAERVPVQVVLATDAKGTDLGVTWSTNEDARPRPLMARRVFAPWARATKPAGPLPLAVDIPELKGGNWERGRRVFHGAAALCAKCHAVGGEGGAIGPDLSNLPHRDYPSVMRDITQPSAAINPDYLTQVLTLTNGRTLTGPVRTRGDVLLVGDDKGQVTEVKRSEVEDIRPSKLSGMPEKLLDKLTPEQVRDLLTFLLADPPRMTDLGRQKPAEFRRRTEVEAVLAGAPSPPGKTRPLTVVLVAGPKDHGPGEHDYPAWQRVWARLLRMADGVTVETADDWPTAGQLKAADVLVFYQQGKWTPERARDMDAFLARGGGAVYVHYAVDGGADAPGFARRIGLAWQGGRSKFRHGPLDLGFESGPGHPIARNLDRVKLYDESYWQLVGDPGRVTLLASGTEDGRPQPLFWTLEPAKGRVVVSIPGHFSWTFDDPLFRVLLFRGIAWAARESVDRFNPLVWPGARLRD